MVDPVRAERRRRAGLGRGRETRRGQGPADPALLAGEAVFAAHCAKCHKTRVAEGQPVSLALSVAVNAPDARNIVHIIHNGIMPPYGSRQRKRDPLGDKLTDDEIASVAAFLRWRFTDLPPWSDIETALTAAPH